MQADTLTRRFMMSLQQALNVLSDILRASPPNQNFLSQLFISPLIPPAPAVPNGHYEAHNDPTSWARAEKVPAVLELISLAIGGEEGVFGREGLRTRAAAVNLFQVSLVVWGLCGSVELTTRHDGCVCRRAMSRTITRRKWRSYPP